MIDLGRILEGIDEGQVVLPDFQRDFEWLDTDVRALLATVLSGWPAGSLLLMKPGNLSFKVRPFEGAPDRTQNANLIVLDGQQRLTSLYHALYNVGPNVYALDFSILAEDQREIDEAIRSFTRQQWERNLAKPAEHFKKSLLPVYALQSASSFFEWRDQILSSSPSEKLPLFKDQITTLYRKTLSAIHKYEFPAVTLESDLAPAAIARIFERVNRHGMSLGTFDLMVAKVYEPNWNLRDKWELSRRDRPILEKYLEDDGMPILQAISLRFDSDLRQSAVLKMSRSLVHEFWERAAGAVASASGFFSQRCGINNLDFFPYRSMLIPAAALAMEFQLDNHEELIKRWFWSKSFSQSYDAAANTRIASDYQELEKQIRSGASNLTFPDASKTALLGATRKGQKALWSAFICALSASDPDGLFVEGRGIDSDAREQLTPVSIFPKIQIATEEPQPHLRVLGQVLVNKLVANKIRRSGFQAAVEDTLQTNSKAAVDNFLSRQFLPPSEFILANSMSWLDVLLYRLEKLEKFLFVEGKISIVDDALSVTSIEEIKDPAASRID